MHSIGKKAYNYIFQEVSVHKYMYKLYETLIIIGTHLPSFSIKIIIIGEIIHLTGIHVTCCNTKWMNDLVSKETVVVHAGK